MADNKDRRDGGFAAGLLGAIVGAIGAATAIFLSKKENRDQVRHKAEEFKEKGVKAWEEVKKETKQAGEKAKESVEETKEEIEKRIQKKK